MKKTLILILSLAPFAINATQQPPKVIHGPEKLFLAQAGKRENQRKYNEECADGCVLNYAAHYTQMPHKNVISITTEDLKNRILRAMKYNWNWKNTYCEHIGLGLSKNQFQRFGSSVHYLFCHFDASFHLEICSDKNGYVIDIAPVTCQQISDSLLQELDLSECLHLNEESKQRLIEAWTKKTVIFPEGRNLENLKLPPKKTSSSAAAAPSASTASTASTSSTK